MGTVRVVHEDHDRIHAHVGAGHTGVGRRQPQPDAAGFTSSSRRRPRRCIYWARGWRATATATATAPSQARQRERAPWRQQASLARVRTYATTGLPRPAPSESEEETSLSFGAGTPRRTERAMAAGQGCVGPCTGGLTASPFPFGYGKGEAWLGIVNPCGLYCKDAGHDRASFGSRRKKKSYKEQQGMSRPGGNRTYAPHAGHPPIASKTCSRATAYGKRGCNSWSLSANARSERGHAIRAKRCRIGIAIWRKVRMIRLDK
jgi:hypothetical protein